jgi:hypothetical protein
MAKTQAKFRQFFSEMLMQLYFVQHGINAEYSIAILASVQLSYMICGRFVESSIDILKQSVHNLDIVSYNVSYSAAYNLPEA